MKVPKDYLKVIRSCFDMHKYKEANHYAVKALRSSRQDTREYILIDAIHKLCDFIVGRNKVLDINPNLKSLKEMKCRLDWACLKRMEFETYFETYFEKKTKDVILGMADELSEVEKVFEDSGAKEEIERITRIKVWIFNEIAQEASRRIVSSEYLQVFHEIAEIINSYLGEDDFAEKILDLLIIATNSERGALFLMEDSRLKLVAGRNVEQETINDARRISRSVVRKAGKKGGIICCPNAMLDPRFKKSKSVILNQIRSVICAPLKVGTNTIGVIYLDSRRICNLFSEKDRRFLSAVTYFVASVIERSKIFQKAKEENIFLRSGIFGKPFNEYLIGESSEIKGICRMIEKIARTDSTVLITGETGSGKGMVARLIHQQSARKKGRFVTVNCGGVPETLFESELFGYKKGAFTGAVNDKKGLFEEADAGTIFFDEIANMPFVTQGKFLEAVETKRIRRLGETTDRKVNVRIISATNRNLAKMMKQGYFRDDLFYRIGGLKIHIPALHEHSVDIPILADYFLEKYALEMNKNILGFDKKALKKMLLYSWPGNVRELQNVIERAVIFVQSQFILADDIKLETETLPLKQKIDNKERLMDALKIARGNISLAAKILGIARCTLYRYIKKYRI